MERSRNSDPPWAPPQRPFAPAEKRSAEADDPIERLPHPVAHSFRTIGVHGEAFRPASASARTVQRQTTIGGPVANRALRAPTVGALVQRVEDEALREGHNGRMNALKGRVINILTVLKEAGQNWEEQYGEKGKRKAEQTVQDKLSGKESDTLGELRKKALKKIWQEMTLEQKAELVRQAGRLGVEAASHIRLPSLPTVEPSPSSGSKREPTTDRQERGGSSALTVLGSLNAEDVRGMWEAYGQIRELEKKKAEAEQWIVEKAGKLGKEGGAFFGGLRDDWEFSNRATAYHKHFFKARDQYDGLVEAIKSNDDEGWYGNELAALNFALHSLNGPMMAFLGINDEARKQYPAVCATAIEAIGDSKRGTGFGGFVARVGSALSSGLSKVEQALGLAGPLKNAQKRLVAKIGEVAAKDWGSKTFGFGKKPKGVDEIRKALALGSDTPDKLEYAISEAKVRAGKTSLFRSKLTTGFYDAIREVDAVDQDSIEAAHRSIVAIERQLD